LPNKLVAKAKNQSVKLTGPNALQSQLTENALETTARNVGFPAV
jgi:hypothetical protein